MTTNEIIDVFKILAMPIALVLVAFIYPLWVKRKKEENMLRACKDDLNTDYKHFKNHTNVYNRGENIEFLHVLWFIDSYKRVLRDAPSQKKIDRDKIRTLVEKMKQDNELFYKIDKLPSKDAEICNGKGNENEKSNIYLWCERRHDYQKTIRETICEILIKEQL